MPKFLRPIVGHIMRRTQLRYFRLIERELKPLFESRIETYSNSSEPDFINEPEDLLQMSIRFAQSNRPLELNLKDITGRIATLNMVSFYQTAIAITNVIYNIVASDSQFNTISVLRDEISEVAQGKPWTKVLLAKMVKTDSVCKETLRIHSFGTRSLVRKVMVDGVKTEDGILLPKGAMVSILARPAQCDEGNFEDPYKFDPFRFSRMRANNASSDDHNSKKDKGANLSFISTSPHYLPFGHGRHACPGRFTIDFELKMMIAYLLTNYELEFPKEYNGESQDATG